jgi:carboxylesterase type B
MTLRVAGDLRDTLAVFVLRFSRMSETVVVRVTQGDLRGRKIITKSGLQYYSFQGIPYAAPPIGKLRFKVSIFILRKKKRKTSSFATFNLIPIYQLFIEW